MIRNFIYLDSHKLRSISSQLFEGITEQVVSYSSEEKTSEEGQKGPRNSGRLLAEIFAKEQSGSELKFMEDHAYTILEKKLEELNLVASLSSGKIAGIEDKNFIKATARIQINDFAASAKLMRDYNKFGEALWRVINESMVPSASSAQILSDKDAKKKASENGFQLNEKIANSAAYIIDFGFHELLEANFSIDSIMVSAPLKREFLRESESMILHKYSRLSPIEFNVLGMVTQRGSVEVTESSLPDVSDAANLKMAMRTLTLHVLEVEKALGAAADHEIVVDPIAIYSVLAEA